MLIIKYILKLILFLFGIMLLGVGLNYWSEHSAGDKLLKDITLWEFLIVFWTLIGVFIVTTLLKGGNITKQLDKASLKKKNKQ